MRIVAPCGIVDPARFARGVEMLGLVGYEPVYDESVILASGRYTAGTDAQRTVAFNAAVADSTASVVWVARGGYGATRVLPGLDLEPLDSHPKWLVGFSDATALHAAWLRKGWGTLHGPNVSTLGRWTDVARDHLQAWLSGASTQRLEGRLLAGCGPAEGPLVGGNLSVLTSLVGTPFLPPLEGAVVLLEDLDEAPYRIDRYLTQLRQSGALDGVRGFVLGQWTRCGDSYEDATHAALDVLLDLDVPVLGHVAVGHERTSWPVPFGARAVLEGEPGGEGHVVLERSAVP